jgi:hypothetical protein
MLSKGRVSYGHIWRLLHSQGIFLTLSVEFSILSEQIKSEHVTLLPILMCTKTLTALTQETIVLTFNLTLPFEHSMKTRNHIKSIHIFPKSVIYPYITCIH